MNEALAQAVYDKAGQFAQRTGRLWGVDDPDTAADVAGNAYLDAARRGLLVLPAHNPKALGTMIAFSAVVDELRRRATARQRFAASFRRIDAPRKGRPIDYGDGGRGARAVYREIERGDAARPGVERPPLWQRMVREVLHGLPPELAVIAHALQRGQRAERVRRRLGLSNATFYRRQKKLKILLAPCLQAFLAWKARLRRR